MRRLQRWARGSSMSTAENVTFMVIRGVIALAIVSLGFYCVAQGIHFFAVPPVEAEQIRPGALIFAVGLALCYAGQRTAPMRIETTRETPETPLWTPTHPEIPTLPEVEGIGMSVAEGHMAIHRTD